MQYLSNSGNFVPIVCAFSMQIYWYKARSLILPESNVGIPGV